jgi:hypothetical protein
MKRDQANAKATKKGKKLRKYWHIAGGKQYNFREGEEGF